MLQHSVKLPKWPLTVAEFRAMMEKWPQEALVVEVKITLEFGDKRRKRKPSKAAGR